MKKRMTSLPLSYLPGAMRLFMFSCGFLLFTAMSFWTNDENRFSPDAQEITGNPDSARFYYEAGLALDKKNDQPQAVAKLKTALRFLHGQDEIKLKGDILSSLANIYGRVPNADSCFHYHHLALDFIEKNWGENSRQMASALNNFAGMLAGSSQCQKAIEARKKALGIVWNMEGEERLKAALCTNLGLLYRLTGDQAQAGDYFRQSIFFIRNTGDEKFMMEKVILHDNYAAGYWQKQGI